MRISLSQACIIECGAGFFNRRISGINSCEGVLIFLGQGRIDRFEISSRIVSCILRCIDSVLEGNAGVFDQHLALFDFLVEIVVKTIGQGAEILIADIAIKIDTVLEIRTIDLASCRVDTALLLCRRRGCNHNGCHARSQQQRR